MEDEDDHEGFDIDSLPKITKTAIDVIDGNLDSCKFKEDRVPLLMKKYKMLSRIPRAQSVLPDLIFEIHEIAPDNIEFRIKFIEILFETQPWEALTEYMKFEADLSGNQATIPEELLN